MSLDTQEVEQLHAENGRLRQALRYIAEDCNHTDWNGQGVTWDLHNEEENADIIHEVARFCGPCAARAAIGTSATENPS